jgi:hypothetical protein
LYLIGAVFGGLRHLMDPRSLVENPVVLLITLFQLWMLFDAIRRDELMWAFWIFIGWGLSAFMYYFLVYRTAGPAAGGAGISGFELPGAGQRRRIKELKTRIYHLDKARDHFDLADIYFAQGRLGDAEAEYRRALERDPADPDTQAHLGQCLMRRSRAAEAEPLLSSVAAADPKHDYGYTLMALAECKTALGRENEALQLWEAVLANNGYARARVQRAELWTRTGRKEEARRELLEIISDDAHAPKFQRKRDKVWVGRARQALKRV